MFHFLDIVTRTTINMHTQEFPCCAGLHLLDAELNGIVGVVVVFSVLLGNNIQVSIVCDTVGIPITSIHGFFFFSPKSLYQHFLFVFLLIVALTGLIHTLKDS